MVLLQVAEMSTLEKQQFCKSKSCTNRESTLRNTHITLIVVAEAKLKFLGNIVSLVG